MHLQNLEFADVLHRGMLWHGRRRRRRRWYGTQADEGNARSLPYEDNSFDLVLSLTTLHNLLEHTEGPPNKPWYQVFEKYSGEIDAKIDAFEAQLAEAMQPFGN